MRFVSFILERSWQKRTWTFQKRKGVAPMAQFANYTLYYAKCPIKILKKKTDASSNHLSSLLSLQFSLCPSSRRPVQNKIWKFYYKGLSGFEAQGTVHFL